MVTFSKLKDGSWGLRGPVSEIVSGVVVTTVRKDGKTAPQTVGKVIWTDGAFALATIGAPVEKPKAAPTAPRRRTRIPLDAHVEAEFMDELDDL